MPDITTSYDAVQTAGIRGDGSTNSVTLAEYTFGDHFATGVRGYGGFRFEIPAGIDPASITDARLKLTARQVGPFRTTVRVEQGDAAAFTTANDATRCDNRFDAAGATGEVLWWDQTAGGEGAGDHVINNQYESPNIAGRVASAITAAGGAGHIAVLTSGNTGINAAHQFYSNLTTAGAEKFPELELTVASDPVDAPVTTVAPSAIEFDAGEPVIYEKLNDVSYDDATPAGYSENRVLDIYRPLGAAPTGGWPVAFLIHGGGFGAGSEEDFDNTTVVNDCLALGMACVSVRYKLTEFEDNFFAGFPNIGWTRPHMVQDVLCAMKWIADDTTYDLNSDAIIGLGYSAGAHLVMEAALLAEDSNPDDYEATYRGFSTPDGDRWTDYPALDHTQGRTGIPTLKGVFSLAGPWDLPRNMIDAPLVLVLLYYYGARGDQSMSGVAGAVSEEGDLGALIEARTGSIYDIPARSPIVPSFPIGIYYATGDTTVPLSASYTPMRAALDTVGYDVSQDTNGTVASGVALSRLGEAVFGNGGGHDGVPTDYDRTFVQAWFTEVLSQIVTVVDAPVTTTAPAPFEFATPPTPQVDVVQDRAIEVSAPAAVEFAAEDASAVGDPSSGTDRPVTTTAPQALEFVLPEGGAGGPIAAGSTLDVGIDNTSGDIVSTASVTPTADAVLFLAIGSSNSSGYPSDDMTVSGLGATWTQVATQTHGFRRRVWLFVGTGATGTGAVTMQYDAMSVEGPIQEVGWVLDELTGVDPTTPTSGAASDGTAIEGDSSSNSTQASIGVTVAATPDAGDATYSMLVLEQDTRDGSPDAGWAELGNTTGTGHSGVRRIETAWSTTADTDVTWSWSEGLCHCAVIGVVVEEAPGGGSGGVVVTIENNTGPVELAAESAGSATAEGTLATVAPPPVELDGTSAGAGTAEGTLATAAAPPVELDGTSAGSGAASGELLTDAPFEDLIGVSVGGATATGSLSVTRVIAGASAGGSTAEGTLATTAPAPVELDGTSVGDGAASGELLTDAPFVDLIGVSEGVGVASGTLESAAAPPVELAGESAGQMVAEGVLETDAPFEDMVGVADGSAIASGTLLTVGNVVELDGAADGSATASGTLDSLVTVLLDGSSAGGSTAEGGVEVSAPVEEMVGTAAGAGDADGVLSTDAPEIDLVGVAPGETVISATLSTTFPVDAVAGTSAGQGGASGTLDTPPVYVDFAGASAGVTVVSGDLLSELVAWLVGVSTGTATATATLEVTGQRPAGYVIRLRAKRSDMTLGRQRSDMTLGRRRRGVPR